jgi:hypothetical protein
MTRLGGSTLRFTCSTFATPVITLLLGLSCSADTVAQVSEWVQIKDAAPAVTLDEPPAGVRRSQHSSFVHPDGSRSDWVLYGTMAESAPNVTIQIVRRAQPLPTRNALVQNLEEMYDIKSAVRRRYGSDYYVLATRFGELRAVSFLVSADGMQKSCLGFHRAGTGQLFVKGYVCSTESARVEPQAIACLLSRVRYVRPADEEALKVLTGETAGKECGATPIGDRVEPSDSRARSTML